MTTSPLADRVQSLQPSFIRQILKVTQHSDIISFAGGLPNPDLFPLEAIAQVTQQVLKTQGKEALQYTLSAGYLPLREWIVTRYYADIPDVSPEDIIITTGSQQALDLIGKLLINPSDYLLVENPSYLGAFQAFSVYQPQFLCAPLLDTGIDINSAKSIIQEKPPKLLYTIPTFQNPTGISYNISTRHQLAQLLHQTKTLLVEDDPYQEIRFIGKSLPSIKSLAPQQTFHLGSFSKSIAPGLRLGWVCSPKRFATKLLMLKECADLHSDHLSQRITHTFLTTYNLDDHLKRIRQVYGAQRQQMVNAIKTHFPPNTTYTKPEGGMFIWVTLPNNQSSSKLFNLAINQKVAFVPGKFFFAHQENDSCLRLNFSNATPEKIIQGIHLLSLAIKKTTNTKSLISRVTYPSQTSA